MTPIAKLGYSLQLPSTSAVRRRGARQLQRAAELLVAIAEHPVAAPPLDTEALKNALWSTRQVEIHNSVSAGECYAALLLDLQEKLTDSAWFDNVRPTRDALARHSRSVGRFFNREYRRAIKHLKSLLRIPLPKSRRDRLQIVETLVQYQEQWHAVASLTEVGRTAFGSLWHDHQSDWSALRKGLEWTSQL